MNQLNEEMYRCHLKIVQDIHPLLFQQWQDLLHDRNEDRKETITTRQINKFNKITVPKEPIPETRDNDKQVVHNLSHLNLDDNTLNILKKGFNYAITPREVPIKEIITNVEVAIQHLKEEEAETVRQEVCHVLRHSRPPKQNITRAERTALKKLRENKEVVILPADKGNATVILNSADYREKMMKLLDDPAYTVRSADPTTYLEKTTKQKILAAGLEKEISIRLIPREKSSRCPRLYGLPKIHKTDVPLRPIVSSVGAPTQALAKFLAKHMQPFTETASSHIKNSFHLLKILKDTTLNPGDLLVSFDVVSLFTSIPIDDAIHSIEELVNPPQHVLDLTKHCLANTYFKYEDTIYKQIQGAPMGSPLSPVVANIFMMKFEREALASAPLKPTLWLRYVDDTFVIWPHGRTELGKFLAHLNQQNNKIQFTMEIEKNGCIPFLDVLLKKRDDGKFAHTVYRKTTHTNRYLNAGSHHHPSQIQAVANSLAHRSILLSDKDNFPQEKRALTAALVQNGFNLTAINKAFAKNKRQQQTEDTTEDKEKETISILPYIRGTTDKIARTLKKHKIKTTFKPFKKINALLRSVKGTNTLESQGVYRIPCLDCEKSYIGRSNRRIAARLDEHRLAINRKDPSSALALHVEASNHSIDYENTKCVAQENYEQHRIIREAIEIETNIYGLNKRDETKKLSSTWKSILKSKLKPTTANNRINITSSNDPITQSESSTIQRRAITQKSRKKASVEQESGGDVTLSRRVTRSQTRRETPTNTRP